MILDKDNLFSDEQALTATAASENVIDLGDARDMGNGEPIELLVVVNETFDSAADGATLTIAVQTDDVEGFGSPTTVQESVTIAEADLAAGEQVFKVKLASADYQRYLRLNYTVGTEDFTAGSLTAGLILDRQNYKTYPSGFSVD